MGRCLGLGFSRIPPVHHLAHLKDSVLVQTQDLLPVHLKLRVENLLCIMLRSVFWFQVSLHIADGDATVKQIGGTAGSDRSSDLLETDVFSVIGGEDAKRQSKLLKLGLNFLSQESALCVLGHGKNP